MDKFYNREEHLVRLRAISTNISNTNGKLSVVVGRRRVGKTRLLKEAFKNLPHKFIYLFVSRKSEMALVDEFANIIQEQLSTKFFQPTSLLEIFEFLFDYAKNKPLTVVVDEFQDIERVDSSVFSGLQNLWDQYKPVSKLHWVCCGSLYSLMTKLFKGSKEPLLNRDDYYFKLQPLGPHYIQQIMQDNNLYSADRLLQWWCLSGGIPKYLEWLLEAEENPFDSLIAAASPLIEEGTYRLVDDFGSEHRTYFSVLAAIASGRTSRARIEDYLGIGIGPILEKLDIEFDIIAKQRPIHAKESSRDVRFTIVDPFLVFWFRFIYANRSAVEMENYSYIYKIVQRDFAVFSGKQLESMYISVLKQSQQFNRIGGYWDHKGMYEIDIVAVNDLDKRILVAEVKRQYSRFKPSVLSMNTGHLMQKINCNEYSIEQRCFSLDNLDQVFDEFKPATTG